MCVVILFILPNPDPDRIIVAAGLSVFFCLMTNSYPVRHSSANPGAVLLSRWGGFLPMPAKRRQKKECKFKGRARKDATNTSFLRAQTSFHAVLLRCVLCSSSSTQRRYRDKAFYLGLLQE